MIEDGDGMIFVGDTFWQCLAVGNTTQCGFDVGKGKTAFIGTVAPGLERVLSESIKFMI